MQDVIKLVDKWKPQIESFYTKNKAFFDALAMDLKDWKQEIYLKVCDMLQAKPIGPWLSEVEANNLKQQGIKVEERKQKGKLRFRRMEERQFNDEEIEKQVYVMVKGIMGKIIRSGAKHMIKTDCEDDIGWAHRGKASYSLRTFDIEELSGEGQVFVANPPIAGVCVEDLKPFCNKLEYEVIKMYFEDGKSLVEIAKELNYARSGIYKLFKRVIDKAKNELKAELS